MKVLFLDAARHESNDAADYYEWEQPGLGRRFEQEVQRGIERVVGYPRAWPVERGDIRKYLLQHFPYKILYSIEADHLLIIAIAHQHRRPDYWVERP